MILEKQLTKRPEIDKETQITTRENKIQSENLDLMAPLVQEELLKTSTTLLKTERSKIELTNRSKSKIEQSASEIASNRTLKSNEDQG